MRKTQYDVLELAKRRWSPRDFGDEKVVIEDIYAVIEAATLAPSCFNEQPWRFVVFHDDEQVKKMKTFLSDGNKIWNENVRSYILILSKKKFDRGGKENKWANFDTGTAWGYLSLEAQKRGLITHAMAGFARKSVAQYLEISEDFTPITLVAIGKYRIKDDWQPNTRLSYEDVIMDKKFED